MPVSLERLIAEVEPNVITEALTRECIQVEGGDAERNAVKKRSIPFKEVQCLAFSFKSLAKIDNLRGLDSLTKLHLDNNQITKIENLAHLANLTCLDLSFNKITVIEGLQKLTKLTDLSLFNNQISKIDTLDTLSQLKVLSLGNNQISQLDNINYLRGFRNLRLINLAGNPICKDHDYRSFVLSHLKDLVYFDHRRVKPADVQAAREQHQDDMIELQEREEQAAQDEKLAGERAAHNKLMGDANLEGVESLADDMTKDDPEWPRLTQVPNLLDPWNEVRDKLNVATDEFKVTILEQHAKKKAEYDDWLGVVRAFLDEKDTAARVLITEFEKAKKKASRDVAENPGAAEDIIMGPKVKIMALKDQLMELELQVVEVLGGLLQEFDRAYSELAETNKGHYNSYFTQVRDLQNSFFNQLTSVAMTVYEKYNQENSDVESLPEDARLLLQDKDSLMNALQASHDVHMGRIDALEDKLVGNELRSANDLTSGNGLWASKRNRDRISEIINYVNYSMRALEEMAGEEDGNEA